jgi:hypothetical protein
VSLAIRLIFFSRKNAFGTRAAMVFDNEGFLSPDLAEWMATTRPGNFHATVGAIENWWGSPAGPGKQGGPRRRTELIPSHLG